MLQSTLSPTLVGGHYLQQVTKSDETVASVVVSEHALKRAKQRLEVSGRSDRVIAAMLAYRAVQANVYGKRHITRHQYGRRARAYVFNGVVYCMRKYKGEGRFYLATVYKK